MGGRHLSLPPPTYRNLLDRDCTIVLIPRFLLGEGWGPAAIEVPWEVPWRLGCLKEPSGKRASFLQASSHIPVSNFRPETCCPSSLFPAFCLHCGCTLTSLTDQGSRAWSA